MPGSCPAAEYMGTKRTYAEIILVIGFVAAVIILSELRGSSNVTVLGQPQLKLVTEPHHAFTIWKENRVRGRELFLFDRHLNAENNEYITGEFNPDEFQGGYSVPALCKTVIHEVYDESVDRQDCSIEELNNMLRTTSFYDIWLKKKQAVALSGRTRKLLRDSRGYGRDFSSLKDYQKKNILLLNRYLLTAAWPELCPPKAEYQVAKDNYIYLAARENMIRKIYHILPESAWEEAARNLVSGGYSPRPDGTFRIVAHGTPVIILRLRDIPRLKEEVLLHVNGGSWPDSQIAELAALLKNNTLKSDLITVAGRISSGSLEMLKADH